MKKTLLLTAIVAASSLGFSNFKVQAVSIHPIMNIQQGDCSDHIPPGDDNLEGTIPSKPPEIQEPTSPDLEQPADDIDDSLNQFEQRVVELTNVERKKQGLSDLKINKELSKVARIKSEDMQKNQYFDHNSPTYGSPFDMMKQFGIAYKTAGENIAQGQRTPEEVVQAWMNSPGHRANILNNGYTDIGVGYVEKGNYWTQQFISK
ncbi:serine protease [Bacillus cereus]|uniref:CAP domain-containing protein n=1 Tax=Bacillus cereus TaxID=1396 RepID=UPI0009D411C7|nr:CAP domain-containing protein [Bacillus cereus]OPA24186.1 serine protease [Bacillus cereus]